MKTLKETFWMIVEFITTTGFFACIFAAVELANIYGTNQCGIIYLIGLPIFLGFASLMALSICELWNM